MKKILSLVVVAMILFSCSVDDDPSTTFTYKMVPTTAVEIPDTLVFRHDYTFNVTYKLLSNCHVFNGFHLEKSGNEQVFGVVNAVYEGPTCETFADSTATAPLHFTAVRDDFYIFKFWQGENENGESVFLTKQVPVKMEQP